MLAIQGRLGVWFVRQHCTRAFDVLCCRSRCTSVLCGSAQRRGSMSGAGVACSCDDSGSGARWLWG